MGLPHLHHHFPASLPWRRAFTCCRWWVCGFPRRTPRGIWRIWGRRRISFSRDPSSHALRNLDIRLQATRKIRPHPNRASGKSHPTHRKPHAIVQLLQAAPPRHGANLPSLRRFVTATAQQCSSRRARVLANALSAQSLDGRRISLTNHFLFNFATQIEHRNSTCTGSRRSKVPAASRFQNSRTAHPPGPAMRTRNWQ